METDLLTLYDLMNWEPLDIPPCSRLYHLEPIGIGTPFTESLTSYFIRLADAHSVSVNKLANYEIKSCIEKQCKYIPIPNVMHQSYFINGTGNWAKYWIQALEMLTLRNDLRFLTMITWENVLYARNLLRHTRAWCPDCYIEWQHNSKILYHPLLWALEAIMVCPKHRKPLQFKCPYENCQKSLPILGMKGRVEYCPYCKGYLAMTPNEDTPPHHTITLSETELEWQLWVADVLGDLIAAAPSLVTLPSRERVVEIATIYMKQISGTNTEALADIGGIDKLRTWSHGTHVPTITSLLKFCHFFNISPLNFLTKKTTGEEDIYFNFGKLNGSGNLLSQISEFLSDEITPHVLEEALTEEPPPFLSDVAKRLNKSVSSLRREFPDQCRKMVKRYNIFQKNRKIQLKQELESILTRHDGPSPSPYEVAKRLSIRPDYFRKHFPTEYQLIREKYQARLEIRRQNLEEFLEKALSQEEILPPAVFEIAKQFHCHCLYLERVFPDQCREIAARRKAYRENQKAALRSELDKILDSPETPLPSLKEVARRFKISISSITKWFPDWCQAFRKKRRIYFESRIVELGKALEALLDNEPSPISLSEVAKRLECGVSTLYTYFPEQVRVIVERHEIYRENEKQEKIEKIRALVRKITFKLYSEGVYPSSHRVTLALPKSGEMRNPEARKAWREALNELGLRN